MKNGYALPFEKLPGVYEESNNKSAALHIDFVQKTISGLERIGVISYVQQKPTCVSPLTVVEKSDSHGKKKLRLCWDGSRHVNNCLKEQKVTLAHLQRALELTEEDDFQTVYDLKSAYHHVKVLEEHRQYLGASITTESGEKQYFVFNYMPFGLGSAVHCITKIFKPMSAYFHLQGIRHTVFIDDGRFLSDSANSAEQNREKVYDTLQKAGWILEQTKSDKEGDSSQVKEYLGFVIDTHRMTVSLTTEKKILLKETVSNLIQKVGSNVKVKELAKCAGRMIAAEPALGRLPIISARPIYNEIEPQVEEKGWNCSVEVSRAVGESLKFFLDSIDKFDHTVIRTKSNEMSVLSIIGPPSGYLKRKVLPQHRVFGNPEIWAGDASSFAVCAYTVTGAENIYFRGKLSEQERDFSSGHRELITVSQALEFYKEKFGPKEEETTIYWLTDSENMATFLNKGSGKIPIQMEVFEIMKKLRELKFRIEPIHLLREDPRIKIADNGSKIQDTDNWSVDWETFQRLNSEWQFTIDMFADDQNKKCDLFYSNFWCPETRGIDAFSQNWDNETAWICPPVKEIIRVVRKIRLHKMSGVLIVPEWPASEFWPVIFSKESKIEPPFRSAKTLRPYIVTNGEKPCYPLSGYTSFRFLALTF